MADVVGTAVLELTTDSRKMIRGMKAGQKAAESEGKKLDKTGRDLSQSMTKAFGRIAASVLTVGTAMKAINATIENVKLAAKFDAISTSFSNAAARMGADSSQIVSSIQQAAGGTISALDAVTAASRAQLFGLPVDELGRLMEIARASARATGESVSFMFDSIVTGIGRASPLILDNLGLTVKIGEANSAYAESMGIVNRELTGAEQKQALLNAVLMAGGKIIDDVGADMEEATDAERWDTLTAAVANLRVELGERLRPAISGIVGTLGEAIQSIAGGLNADRLIGEFQRSFKDFDQLTLQELQRLQGAVKFRVDSIQSLMSQAVEQGLDFGTMAELIDEWEAELVNLQPIAEGTAFQIGVLTREAAAAAAALGSTNDELDDFVRRGKNLETNPKAGVGPKLDIQPVQQYVQDAAAAFRQLDRELLSSMDQIVENNRQMWRDIASTAVDISTTFLNQLQGVFDAYFDWQLSQEGLTAKEKEKIARKQFAAEKAFALATIAINAAAAIIKGFAVLGPIGGAIFAAVIGGLAIAQGALVASTKFKPPSGGFKDDEPTDGSSGGKGSLSRGATFQQQRPIDVTVNVFDNQVLGGNVRELAMMIKEEFLAIDELGL
jgi:energy-converting hydrogenase Eha subunit A